MTEVQFELDLMKSPVYAAGAFLISLLAFPNGGDPARRNLQATLCHVALSTQFDLKSADAWIEQPIKPVYRWVRSRFRRGTMLSICGG